MNSILMKIMFEARTSGKNANADKPSKKLDPKHVKTTTTKTVKEPVADPNYQDAYSSEPQTTDPQQAGEPQNGQQPVDQQQYDDQTANPDELSQQPQDPSQPGFDINNPEPPIPYNATTQYLGRIYELRKIYLKLLSISTLLTSLSDSEFDNLENTIRESLDLFHIVISNIDKFEDKIDEIIIYFYEFVKETIIELERLSDKRVAKSEEDNPEKKDKK